MNAMGVAGHPRDEEVIVLGAGVSGLVGASTLLRQGCESVLLIDEYDRVGGNHIDVTVGDYTFDIGSLIFQDDSPLLDHFPMLLDRYVEIEPRWSKVNPRGVVTEYPFSLRDDLLATGVLGTAATASSALMARLDRRRPHNAQDFARHALGARFLSESGLDHYMAKLCGSPIDEIELAFAESRMAWVADQTRPREVGQRLWRALTGRQRPPDSNRQLARPRGGFSELYAPVVADLEARGASFQLGSRVSSLRAADDDWLIESDVGQVRAGRVVATIPVERTMQMLGLTPPPLPTVTLLSLFFSFDGDRGFDDTVLYNFTHRADWKRLTVYSDFYGRVGGSEYFTVEAVSRVALDASSASRDFEQHAAQLSLFRGGLRLEGHHLLEHAYPVFTRGSGDRAQAARARVAAAGIASFGRQGGFQYQPTARVSTLEAENALGAPRGGQES